VPKAAKPLPPLTDTQKAILETNWHQPPDIILALVFPDQPNLDLRSVHWKACRAYLATIGRDPGNPGSGPQPKGIGRTATSEKVTELTSGQREFIEASYVDASGPLELARTLWEDETMNGGDHRVRLVMAYIRKIDPNYRKEDEEVDEVDYQPPKTVTILAGRLNRYGIGTRADGRLLGDGETTTQEIKQLHALLRYMRRPVFKVEADKFTKKLDREVFEEIFMSTCWDKPELSPEHVLQYITLASVMVQKNQADRTARKLTDRFEDSLQDPTKRLSKPEVDALKNTADKTAESVKQMNTLIKTLAGEHKAIQEKRIAGASSMHPLVEAWKTVEDRKRIIGLVQKKQQAALKEEVERLSTMDSLKAEIWGIDPVSILH
jgi:hypothetical protein